MKTHRFAGGVALLGLAVLLSAPIGAQLTPYDQDFEGMDPLAEDSLANAGWLVFGNVFGPDWSYWYGYGTFPAPNQTAGFCSVAAGQGGPDQGDQQLVTYSDYNNGNHFDGSGAFIEANVFQEQTIGAADVGTTWTFEFDAKRGDIAGGTTASAFFKTLDPNAGFALTNFIPVDLTNIPDAWNRYSMSIFIDASLEGQLLQFGYASLASGAAFSGMFYDNVSFSQDPLSVNLDIRPRSCPNPINGKSRGVIPVALLGSADLDVTQIDAASLRLEGVAPEFWSYEDVASPFAGEEACGCTGSGPDGVADLTIKFDTQAVVNAFGASSGGEQVFTLTGSLLDGTPIEGQDCVVFVGGNRPVVIMQDDSAGFGVFGESDSSDKATSRDSSWRSKGPKIRKR